jgi:hypothetical protein
MIQGRYLASGCSKLWCDWRDGKTCATPSIQSRRELLDVFKQMRRKVAAPGPEPDLPELDRLGAVRRLLQARERRILELEGSLTDLWEKNGHLHDTGQAHIDHLERQNAKLLALKQCLEKKVSLLHRKIESKRPPLMARLFKRRSSGFD